MKLHHFIFLFALVLMFIAPKLMMWALALAFIGMLVMAGPVLLASLLAPRPPKR